MLEEISSDEATPKRLDTLENIYATFLSGQVPLLSIPREVLELLVTDLLLLSSNASPSETSLILSIFKRLLCPSLYPQLSSLIPPSHLETAVSGALPLQVMLTCEFLRFVVSQNPASVDAYLSSSLLTHFAALFSHQDLELVESVTSTLVCLCSHPSSLSLLLSHSSPLVSGLRTQLEQDTSAIRVLTAISQICRVSETAFGCCKDLGFLASLSDHMSCEDPLSFLCYLDILHYLCQSGLGYSFYLESGLLARLSQLVLADSSDPSLQMVRHDIIIFFFSLLSLPHVTSSHDFSHYQSLYSLIFSLLHSPDDRSVKVFMESLSHLSSFQQGRALLSSTTQLSGSLSMLGAILSSGSSEQKVRVLEMFSLLLRRHGWMADAKSYSQQAQFWFGCVGSSAMKTVLQLAKQPFPDVQVGAFSLCRSLAQWRWGQEHLRNCPGFLEFLINREIISGEEVVHARFGVISTLAESDISLDVLGGSFYTKIREQHTLGPYYLKAQYVVEVGND